MWVRFGQQSLYYCMIMDDFDCLWQGRFSGLLYEKYEWMLDKIESLNFLLWLSLLLHWLLTPRNHEKCLIQLSWTDLASFCVLKLLVQNTELTFKKTFCSRVWKFPICLQWSCLFDPGSFSYCCDPNFHHGWLLLIISQWSLIYLHFNGSHFKVLYIFVGTCTSYIHTNLQDIDC